MAAYTEKIYRLVDILDREGNSRAETDPWDREFYQSLRGCIARNIREDITFRSATKFANWHLPILINAFV